jgi:hypothetical protein
MVTRNPNFRSIDFGLAGPPPMDLIVLLGVLIVTFVLRFFAATQIVPLLLELTPFVWMRGWVWQLATYPFVGYGTPGIGFLIELLILYMFGKDVFFGLYRRHFWRLIVWAGIGAAVVAVGVHALLALSGAMGTPAPFTIMQGQRILLAIFIAAFATAHRDATVYLFFFLQIPARWLFVVEALFALMAFLSSRDLPGFIGICAAMGFTYLYVRSSGSVRGGRKTFREIQLRLQRWWIQRRLDRARRQRGFKVIPGEGGRRGAPNVRKGPWVN